MKRHTSIAVSLVFSLLVTVTFVLAQEQEQSNPASVQQPQTLPAQQQAWSSEQLDNLVAPIALYPDPLLSQVFAASTYPLEVVEAYQWLQRNKQLRGQELVDAAKQQPWDPSVQALVAIPEALEKLNQDIRWTTDLGNAFLSQQADVMSAVQRMRARAQGNGRLSSTPQQTVRVQEQGGQKVIVVQPADPRVIYVPAYDPFYIWGPPVYGYYPPLYYPAFGFGFGIGFNVGFCFGGWGGWAGWGWLPNWFGHSVYFNNYFFHRHGFHHPYGGSYIGRTAWVHDPTHRMRVPYGNHQVAARFGGGPIAPRNSFRPGGGPAGAAIPSANRLNGSYAGGARGQQAYRNVSPQVQRFQNPPQQRYQPSQQYRTIPQTRRFQDLAQQRDRPSQQLQGTPQMQRFQNPPQQRNQSSQQFRAVPQMQGFRSIPQQRFQPSQQFRSAPQMSAPRFSGNGGFSRSGSGGRHR